MVYRKFKKYTKKRRSWKKKTFYTPKKKYPKINVGYQLNGKASKIHYAKGIIQTFPKYAQMVKSKDVMVDPTHLTGRSIRFQQLYGMPFQTVLKDQWAYNSFNTQSATPNQDYPYSVRWPSFYMGSTMPASLYMQYVQPGQELGAAGNPYLVELSLYRKFMCNKITFNINAEALTSVVPAGFYLYPDGEHGNTYNNAYTNPMSNAQLVVNIYAGTTNWAGQIPDTNESIIGVGYINNVSAERNVNYVRDLNLKRIKPDVSGTNFSGVLYNPAPVNLRTWAEIKSEPEIGDTGYAMAYICIEYIVTINSVISAAAWTDSLYDEMWCNANFPVLEINYCKKILAFGKESVTSYAVAQQKVLTEKKNKMDEEDEKELEEIEQCKTLSQKCLQQLKDLELNKLVNKTICKKK